VWRPAVTALPDGEVAKPGTQFILGHGAKVVWIGINTPSRPLAPTKSLFKAF
jgi:hypothetical protein